MSHPIRIEFAGANRMASLEGDTPTGGRSNYIAGADRTRWITGVPHFERVRYRSIYPNADAVFYVRDRELEYDLELAPGADPRSLRLRISGARRLRLNPAGDLVIETDSGTLLQRRPAIFQSRNGVRTEVEGRYRVLRGGLVAFDVASYDRRLPLTIDPVLSYATYLGGTGTDTINAIGTDSAGAVYVAGSTFSADFPSTAGALQPNFPAGVGKHGFVTKLNAAGSAILYSTYLGGNGTDSVNGMAVDSGGNVYVAGETTSSNFPVTAGAFQASLSGSSDAFITKLNFSGSALVYSTYAGGTGPDGARCIAIDSSGAAFVAGYTSSSDFPVSATPFQRSLQGGYSDGFVLKLNAAGTSHLYGTFLGGSDSDSISAIAVYNSGGSSYAYVTGSTTSANFPTTTGAVQAAYGGSGDAFVTKLTADGGFLLYSTFLGGSQQDVGNGIAVDSSGNAYVAGGTGSADFRTTSGAYQTGMNYTTAFVVKLNSAATAFGYSTFLGAGGDTATAVVVDGSGNATVTGYTNSPNFPVRSEAFQYSIGSVDAFLTRLNAAGSDLLYSTLLGGAGQEQATALAADSSGNVYIGGYSTSKDFPATTGAVQTPAPGGQDGFIAKFDFSTSAVAALFTSAQTLTFQSFVVASGNSTPAAQTISVATTGGAVAFRPTISTSSGGNWLSITGDTTTPSTITVQADPAGLAAGSYYGTVSFVAAGVAGGHSTVSVALIVQRPVMYLGQSSLTFDYTAGGDLPASQTVSANTYSGAPLSFSSVTTTAGWLHVTPASGSLPANFTVSVQPSGLPNGIYSATIHVNAPLADPYSQTSISVTLRVGPQLKVTTSTSFYYIVGGTPLTPVQWAISSSGPELSFSASASSSGWLTVSPSSGTTPATLTLTADPTGLAPGYYYGTVTLAAPGSITGSLSLTISLSVVRPSLYASLSPQTIQAASGSSSVVTGDLFLYSSPTGINFTASSAASWLKLGSTSGATNQSISVKADPTGLADGTYSGTITVTAPSASNSPLPVPVTLTIGPMLAVSNSSLVFSTTSGGSAPAPQAVVVSAGSRNIAFTSAVTTGSGGNWLSVSSSSSTTPATMTVNIDPTGLPGGFYSGTISLSSSASLVSPLTVNVSLTVGPQLTVSLGNPSFTQAPGGPAPAPQALAISTGSSTLPYSVQILTGGTWLSVNPTSGTTPATLTVSANAGTLPPGVYPGILVVTAAGASNSPTNVNVTLTVSQSMTVSPGSLFFSGLSPGTQPISVSATVPLTSATASAVSTGWLSVVPGSSGTGSFVASANPAGLAPGSYLGAITFNAAGVSNSPQSVQVTLTVPQENLVFPGNGATGVQLAPSLSWLSLLAASYDVYFGTSATPPLAATVSTTTYSPGALSPDTTYYWRVVAKGAAVSVSSVTNSFRTQVAASSLAVSPSSGAATVQTFSAVAVQPGGYTNLAWVEMLFAAAPDGGGQPYCFVHYDVQGRTFWLYGDGGFFVGPVAAGTSSNLLQNSFCALNTLGSSAFGSGTSLTVNASLTFKGSGIRNLYLRSLDRSGVDSGWLQRGAISAIPATASAMSAAPNSGNGATQTFVLTYPDPPGFAGANFGWAQFLVATASNGGGQPFCFVHYDRAGNGLWMYSGDVGYFVGPVAPGAASTLLNSSACSVNTAGATVTSTQVNGSGNLVVSVPITFKSPMSGAKLMFQRTLDVLTRDSGWQQSGAWSIP